MKPLFLNYTQSTQAGGVPLQNMSFYEELDDGYRALKEALMNPEFQRVLAEIQSLPSPTDRLQAAFTQLTPDALMSRGIRLPENFTITTHTSQDSAGPTSPANVAAMQQNTADKPELSVHVLACKGISIGPICIPIPIQGPVHNPPVAQ